jgi:hypothetical protein
MELIDVMGNAVRKKAFEIIPGINQLVIDNTASLPAGIYFLRIKAGDKTIQKRVLKQNQ